MEFLKNGLETMSKQEIDKMIRENRDNNNSLLKYVNDNVIREGTNYENWQNKINKVSAEQAFFTVSFEFYGEGTGANYPQHKEENKVRKQYVVIYDFAGENGKTVEFKNNQLSYADKEFLFVSEAGREIVYSQLGRLE